MAQYTARIELADPAPGAIRSLQRAMEAAGFSVQGPGAAPAGERTRVAEFNRRDGSDLEGAFEAARLAAAEVGAAFSVLVTESASRRWIGVRICRNAS